MDSDGRQARLEQFERLCRERGLSVTVQRRVIYEALLGRQDHPTADQVYELVQDRIPGVSRTTVYRVLETLVQVGVITRLCHPGSGARFDPKVHRHHHLVCARCGAVADFEHPALDRLELPAVRARGFEIQEFSIHFRGSCSSCRRPARRADRAGGAKVRPPTAQRGQRKTKAQSTQRRRNRP